MTEPDAWMAYNGAGGAGKVPYLIQSKADANSVATMVDEEYPKPLFSGSTIQEKVDEVRHYQKELQNCTCPKDKKPCKHKIAANQVKKTIDFFEESFKQKGGEE